MNRRVILVLIAIIALGLLALYAIQRGPSLFLRPPDHDRIAFISDQGGHVDIWTMRADGSDKIRVTDDSADDRLPTWSPDLKEIASISNRREGIYEVFVSAWDGSYTHCLTTSEGTKDIPVWSSDGKEIVFISSGKVFVMSRNGGREAQYLPPPGMSEEEKLARGLDAPFAYAAWSPGRKTLLCVQETDFGKGAYVVEPTWMTSSEVEFDPLGIVMARGLDVAWAPSGQTVAAGFINRKGENGLLVVDLETVRVRDLFVSKGDGTGAAKPAWSPDGKKIAFEMWEVKDGIADRCLGIYVIGASGGRPRRLVDGDAREPTWSPDGKSIACTVPRPDSRRDIWRISADGSGRINLTNGKGDNYSPTWSHAVEKNR